MKLQQVYQDIETLDLHQIDEDNQVFCLLNSNAYPNKKIPFNYLLGVGIAEEINISQNENAFQKLTDFQKKNEGQFLFAALNYDLKNEVYPKLKSLNSEIISFPLAHIFQPAKVFVGQKAINFKQDQTPSIPLKLSLEDLQAHTNKTAYLAKVNQLKSHLIAGDIYEITYCIAFSIKEVEIEPIALYCKLNTLSPMPFSALYKNNEQYLICASPERFLGKRGNKIFSEPIKGTRKRNADPVLDQLEIEKLQKDPKEIAENVMIVDLVRNDLTKSAKLGTIKVTELFGIHSFSNLHQMISTIEAELKEDCGIFDCIQNAFPMGSMTGAPKLRAMEIIEEVEDTTRGLFSGSIGYISPD
ncbi:MAG: hypothetical protein RI952_1135, partial [Bacteroidota bacterium]